MSDVFFCVFFCSMYYLYKLNLYICIQETQKTKKMKKVFQTKNISFTTGTIQNVCDEYSNLTLFKNDVVVYKSTIPNNIIETICELHKNILKNGK